MCRRHFFNEPTAALDDENKRSVFELLSKIKKDVLVICSSHDSVAREYADEVIFFNKCHELSDSDTALDPAASEKKNNKGRKENKENKRKKASSQNRKKSPYVFLKKWFTSGYRNRKSSVLFGIFLTIAICICMLTDTPDNKMASNMEYVYKINMCMLRTYEKNSMLYDSLCKIPGIAEAVLDYGLSVPKSDASDQNQNHDTGETFEEAESPQYYQDAGVLPFDKEAFKLSYCIQYGTYFTEKNQVILSYEYAESLSNGFPEKLIGHTLNKSFYKVGNIEMEIVGIFKPLNEFEQQYFNACEYYQTEWFISSEFTKEYAEDEDFYAGEQRGYILYFKSYKDMKKYYDENAVIYSSKGDTLLMGLGYGKLGDIFRSLFAALLPLAVFIAVFAILFYVNLIKTEIVFNDKFISVFDYAGYPLKKVIRCLSVLNLFHLLKICLLSSAASLLITSIINYINRKQVFVGFQIFSYNYALLLSFLLLIGGVSVLFTWTFLRRLKASSWYENILKQRDLM